jgi:hypothetical protein
MRKNMKIPRRKENSEQPIELVIILRSIRLPSYFEPTRGIQTKGMEGNFDEEQCM